MNVLWTFINSQSSMSQLQKNLKVSSLFVLRRPTLVLNMMIVIWQNHQPTFKVFKTDSSNHNKDPNNHNIITNHLRFLYIILLLP